MLTRTNSARAALISITIVWFAVPVLGCLFEVATPIRFLVGLVACRTFLTFLGLFCAICLAACLYPTGDARSQTVLPLVCFVLSFSGFGWLESESASDDMGGVFSFAGIAGSCLLLTAAAPFLWKTRHRSLLLAGPVGFIALLFVLRGWHELASARDRGRLAQVVDGIEAYHDRTGAYPETLERLLPNELDVIPRPATWFWLGSHYHYEPTNAPEQGPRPYSYSIYYLVNGDMGFGTWGHRQRFEATYSDAFGGDPGFDYEMPQRRVPL